MAARGRGLFSLYIYIENFKNLLFQYNLAGMSLWSPSTKVVQAVMIRQKIWLLGGWAYFPYISI